MSCQDKGVTYSMLSTLLLLLLLLLLFSRSLHSQNRALVQRTDDSGVEEYHMKKQNKTIHTHKKKNEATRAHLTNKIKIGIYVYPRRACFVQGWQYSADKLRVELLSIPPENKDVQAMAAAVKEVCLEHGVKLAICASKRGQVPGREGRLLMCALKCVHGMPNRQAEWKGNLAGERYRINLATRGQTPPPPPADPRPVSWRRISRRLVISWLAIPFT